MRSTTIPRLLTVALVTTAVGATAVGATATPATATVGLASVAAAARCDDGTATDDLADDVLVGVHGSGPGTLDVRATGTPRRQLSTADVGGVPGQNDDFGRTSAVGDLDGDGCSDLVVGAPGEGAGGLEDFTGQVHLVFGGPTGIVTAGAITLPHDSTAYDLFGAALALVARDGGHDLYVGAPEAMVNGKVRAGEVFRYTITPGGAGRVTVTAREVLTQDTPGVPGVAEVDDRFGRTLAAVPALGTAGGSGVLVGDPYEDVGARSNAGSVTFLPVDPAGTVSGAQVWTQDSPGVPGKAESGDRFGAAVAGSHRRLAVGVPGEDAGSVRGTGMVQLLNRTTSPGFTPGRALTEATPGVPGTAQAGDGFGTAVVLGTWLLCQESTDLAVGAPGERGAGRRGAGAVVLLALVGEGDCPGRMLQQGSGLAGAAETGDMVGEWLTTTPGDPDAEEDYRDRLLIGVPREDIGGRIDQGMVQPARGGLLDDGVLVAALTDPTAYRYGTSLSSPTR